MSQAVSQSFRSLLQVFSVIRSLKSVVKKSSLRPEQILQALLEMSSFIDFTHFSWLPMWELDCWAIVSKICFIATSKSQTTGAAGLLSLVEPAPHSTPFPIFLLPLCCP